MIKSRRLIWAAHVIRNEEGMSALKIVTGKLKGKRTIGTRSRWEDVIRMYLKDMCQYKEFRIGIEPSGSISYGVIVSCINISRENIRLIRELNNLFVVPLHMDKSLALSAHR